MPNFSTISPLIILFILCVFSFYCLLGIETYLINNSLKACGNLDSFMVKMQNSQHRLLFHSQYNRSENSFPQCQGIGKQCQKERGV